MNLSELISKLSREKSSGSPEGVLDSSQQPTKFYQMECRSHHYYTAKFARQLPLREVEGFCKVQMRHTTSRFKQGKLIHVADYKKPGYMRDIRKSIQHQPQLGETVRTEMLRKHNNVIRLSKDTAKSLTSCTHSSASASPLPEVEST